MCLAALEAVHRGICALWRHSGRFHSPPRPVLRRTVPSVSGWGAALLTEVRVAARAAPPSPPGGEELEVGTAAEAEVSPKEFFHAPAFIFLNYFIF